MKTSVSVRVFIEITNIKGFKKGEKKKKRKKRFIVSHV